VTYTIDKCAHMRETERTLRDFGMRLKKEVRFGNGDFGTRKN